MNSDQMSRPALLCYSSILELFLGTKSTQRSMAARMANANVFCEEVAASLAAADRNHLAGDIIYPARDV